MKKYLFVVLMLPAIAMAQVTGDASVFATEADGGVGFTFNVQYQSGPMIYRADWSLANDIDGNSLSIGYKVNKDIKIFIGSSLQVKGESQTTTVDVSGVDVSDSATGSGDATFAEIEYKNFYVRHNMYDLTYDYSASRQTGVDGMDNPVFATASRTDVREDSVTWVGYRFKF